MNLIKEASPGMPLSPTVIFRGKVLVESGGIIEYLMAQFPSGEQLAPARTSPAFADYAMWMHFAEGTAATRIHAEAMRVMGSADRTIKPALLGGVFKIVGAQDVVDYVESHIADHPYFAGDVFSAADIMMEFVATYISVLPFDPASYRNLAAWQKKVQARPAYQRAIAIGAPDGLEKFRMPRR